MKKTALKGFTLIELLIVIAIIGVLAAIVLVAIDPAEKLAQARDSGRKSDLGQIATALEAYFTSSSNAQYPANQDALTSSELRKIPKDPKTGASYTMSLSAASDKVALYSTLESKKDRQNAANGWWCWRSSAGAASAITTAGTDCTAT